jgi:signal transduction histidine kinase/ligand-binding sensor domain-containing protein
VFRRLATATTIAALLAVQPAFALNPTLDISQYVHTGWKLREGFARAFVRAIAQTRDGYLWFGTEFELVRFDGVQRVAWQPPPGQALPSSEIHSLVATPDGGLWIGTAKGLARWKDGTLTEVAPLAGQIILSLFADRQGTVWAGTLALRDAKVCAIEPSSVQCYGGSGHFGSAAVGLHEDANGTVWLGVSEGLWRLKPGPAAFHPVPGVRDSIRSFVSDRGLLFGTSQGIKRMVDGRAETFLIGDVSPQLNVRSMLRDLDGALWLGTMDRGLIHVRDGRTDVFTTRQGLSGDHIAALFEDREGNIWVATDKGIDRFRDIAVPSFGPAQDVPDLMVTSVLAARDGSIWFGADGMLNQWSQHRRSIKPITIPNSLFQDRQGRIWVSALGGHGYFEDGRYAAVRGIPVGRSVHAIGDDADGNVWIAHQDEGLFRVAPHGAIARVPWATFGRKDFATALVADPQRGFWIGFQDGGVVHFEGGERRATYATSDGLAAGRVNSLRFDRHGALWAATAGGLSRVSGGRVATLTSRNGLPCDAVQWDIEDDAQAIWVYMACGLARIPVSELDAWAASVDTQAQATRILPMRVFDGSDGVTSQTIPAAYTPQVAKGQDGRIWFVSPAGLSAILPRQLPFNHVAPPVHVEQITGDGTTYTADANRGGLIRLPALTRDVRIDYTALSLVAAEKMRFRYKLEGQDRDWQEAGNRRQAFYNDLAPRPYRFRVIASNDSGVWNQTGAALDFVVAPAYYQTTWFRLLAVTLVLAGAGAAHRIRVRMVERHRQEISALNARLMKAQEQERIRIAGELHDGVMQEMVAATMMLGTAKRRIAADADAQGTIEKIQEKLIRVGTDIRQLSHDLHPPALQTAGLPEAVRVYCEQFSASCSVPVACDADDDVRDLSRGAALALFRIVQEALGNAARHGQATAISVRLSRAAGIVSLVVSDNGVGFDASGIATSGGLGLIMMRERTSQLDGKFEFEGTPGRGTTIRVAIPFR